MEVGAGTVGRDTPALRHCDTATKATMGMKLHSPSTFMLTYTPTLPGGVTPRLLEHAWAGRGRATVIG